MRATGIVRKLDVLGRAVIPMDLRRRLNIDAFDPIEISVDRDMLILTKYYPKCVFCSGTEDVIEKLGRHICRSCINELTKL